MTVKDLGSWDVVVVGSGPAGAAAALSLAEGGARVLVLEKSTLPRYKTCGGGLVARAQALVPASVLDRAVQRQFHRVELNLLDSGLTFAAERDVPIMGAVMREEFDFALLEAACEAGAEQLAPCAMRGLSEDASAQVVDTERGRLRTQILIGADGVCSPVARTGGWRRRLSVIPALEWEAEVPDEVFERFQVAPRFDFGAISRGYGWVFPKDGHLSVGIGCAGPPSTNLNQALRTYLEQIGCQPIRSVRKHGYVIPLRPHRRFARGRVLLTGDAAGLTDPVTFEGISHALLSGRLAAQEIIRAELDPHRAGHGYQRRLAREILPELRLARGLARLLYGPVGLRDRLFRYAGTRLVEAMTEVICGRSSYRGYLYSPRRYARLLYSPRRS